MTTIQNPPQSLEEKHHFLLRKLHSLSGIVPVGVFLCEHMLTNSLALKGEAKFNESVLFLHGLPYLLLLEIFGIFLPLAFHAIYGLKIARSAEINVGAYPYPGNRRYTLQRITGYIAFVFIIVHLLKFRFAHLVGWGPEFMDPHVNKYQTARDGLLAWKPFSGMVVPAWLTISFYVVGLWAACYHFANGIWSFCISWGIVVGEKAQRRIGVFAAIVGIVLFAGGSAGLYGLVKAPVVRRQEAQTTHTVESAAEGAAVADKSHADAGVD